MDIEIDKIRSTARTPTYSGTESTEWSGPDLEDYLRAFDIDAEQVSDLTQEQKSKIVDTTLLGSADADTYDELVFFPVVNPSNMNLSENALRAVITGRGAQADIPASTKNSAQNKARSLLKEEFGMDEEKSIDKTKVSSSEIEEFVASLYKGIDSADIKNTLTEQGEFIGLNKRELATLVGHAYGVGTDEVLGILNTLPELQMEMNKLKKEDLVETVRQVRSGELEVSEALDEFVDIDSETIKEIKEELEKEEKATKDTGEKGEQADKGIEDIINDKVEKIMEEEDLDQPSAMVKLLDREPKLYTKYKYREVGE